MQDSATRTLLTIDDGTGKLEVMQWVNDGDSDHVSEELKEV